MRTVGEGVTRSRGELHGGPANESERRGREYSQSLDKIEHEEKKINVQDREGIGGKRRKIEERREVYVEEERERERVPFSPEESGLGQSSGSRA